MKTLPLKAFVILSAAALATQSFGQVVYNQNFDVDDTANWAVNGAPATTDVSANFYFDYSTVGIPAAPNSGSTTRGLKIGRASCRERV